MEAMVNKEKLPYREHYRHLEIAFQRLNAKFIRLKESDRLLNNKILYMILEKLLKIMRQNNTLFDLMKPRFEYMGSYFEGLRVGEPTEYDINIVLTLPINYNKIRLDAKGSAHGYTSLLLPSEFQRLRKHKAFKDFEQTKTWCDSKYRMSVKKFRSWMQSVVDVALLTLNEQDGKKVISIEDIPFTISTKMSGPASTLTIMASLLKNPIDIDLVPAFMFETKKQPEFSTVDFSKTMNFKFNSYFLVPKPTRCDFTWRLAFPLQEREFLRNKDNLKGTVKLLKMLRDTQGFNELASYYIKTLFLWQIEGENEEFWSKNSLSFLVMYMMKVLRDCLNEGIIQNYWCPSHNLLENVKSETLKNWANRISLIIKHINVNGKKNPEIIYDFFV